MTENKGLSRQETNVLAELAKGSLYKQIAVELGISINTVKKHLKNIYRKLEVSNRKHAASFQQQTQEIKMQGAEPQVMTA